MSQYTLSIYEHPVSEPELELTCKVYNINKGRNRRLLERCRFLEEYMIFVDYVRLIVTQIMHFIQKGLA